MAQQVEEVNTWEFQSLKYG